MCVCGGVLVFLSVLVCVCVCVSLCECVHFENYVLVCVCVFEPLPVMATTSNLMPLSVSIYIMYSSCLSQASICVYIYNVMFVS